MFGWLYCCVGLLVWGWLHLIAFGLIVLWCCIGGLVVMFFRFVYFDRIGLLVCGLLRIACGVG